MRIGAPIVLTRRALAASASALLLVSALTTAASAEDAITFVSPQIQACFEAGLGTAAGVPITPSQAATITSLDCDDNQGDDVSPLEYATSLTSLHLKYGDQGVEAYLPAMAGLESLSLDAASPQSVIDAAGMLPQLKNLAVQNSGVNSLVPLSGLGSLTSLNVRGAQQLHSLSGLGGLTSLRHLDVNQSSIESLAPIAALPHLEYLDIAWTNVDDLAPLSGLTTLTNLSVACWTGTDPAPVMALVNLTVLSLPHCGIDDASFFTGLTKLRTLHADSNELADLTALASLADLETLSATGQTVQAPDVSVCVPHEVPAPLYIDGTRTTLTAPLGGSNVGVFQDGFATWVRGGYDNTMKFASPDGAFSGTLTERSPGIPLGPCKFDAAPSVAIAGETTVGSTISMRTTGDWSPSPSDGWTDILWTRDGVGVGTDSTYEVTSADSGHDLKVRLRGGRPGFEIRSVTSDPLSVPATFDPAWVVTFVNPPIAGFVSSVDKLWEFPSSETSCDWFINGRKVATTSTCEYLIPTSAAGAQLMVRVVVTRDKYVTATYESASLLVLRYYGDHSLYSGTISGSPDVGKVLTVTPTVYSPAATSYSYQWLRDGDPIGGATGKMYTIVTADAGRTVSVAMTARRTGYYPATDESVGVRVHRLFTTAVTPTITGAATVGSTLTLGRGTWLPTPTYSYRWFRNGAMITGATQSTYKTTTADIGKRITVRVMGARAGYTTTVRMSAALVVTKKFTATPTPVISGAAVVGHTVAAKPGAWGPAPVTLTYQWFRNGAAIPGATKSTYTLVAGDAYATLTLRAIGAKVGYTTFGRTSTPHSVMGIAYSNCAALQLAYPGGVAKTAATVDMVNGAAGLGIAADTFVSAQLYALNSGRDRDNDGWACEP